MKKLLLKPLAYILFFIITLLIMFPKENIYYFFEKKLSSQNIILSNEKIDETLLGLNLKDIDLYSNDLRLANISYTNFFTYVFFTKITVDKIKVDDSFRAFVPLELFNIEIKHSVLNPLIVLISGKCEIGDISGSYDISSKTIKLTLTPLANMSSNYKTILSDFKSTDGSYKYEYKH